MKARRKGLEAGGKAAQRPKSVVADALAKKVFAVELWIENIAGGVPASPDLLKAHLERKGLGKDKVKEVVAEAAKNGKPEAGIAKAEKISWTTFLKDEKGFYLIPSQFKAMLRDGMVALGLRAAKGKRGMKHQWQSAAWIDPNKIYMLKDGKHVTEAEYREKPLHVMGPQGPRDCLCRYDVLEGVTVAFTITIVDDEITKLTSEDLKRLFALGENGCKIGAHKPLDVGRFITTKFEEV